ncbi:MAG: TetR/AcrR family transcriptional regulator [Cyclobacteriaceae bacterium]|nr:TetR/AcrR family transcriptional regulator [Cyclobacteriaceae bacterium]
MRNTKSYDRWIEIGYHQLASASPEGIHVEELSRLLDLNKSGFYYYFGTRETYFEHLANYHIRQAELLMDQLKHHLILASSFRPFFDEFKLFLLVHRQMLLSQRLPCFAAAFEKVNLVADPILAEIWISQSALSLSSDVVAKFIALVRDAYLSNSTEQSLTWASLDEAIVNAEDLIRQLQSEPHRESAFAGSSDGSNWNQPQNLPTTAKRFVQAHS